MADSEAERVVVFALYPGVTQLDFTGPLQVFSRLPRTRAVLASRDGGALAADGLMLSDLARLADIARCAVLCVPGGPGATAAGLDEAFLAQVRRLAENAGHVTSVCTGSLVLGAAGLLAGRRAACHWAWRDLLPLFGALPQTARVVRDGRFVTGGGVTAGIDFALALAAELEGETVAQAIQLGLEYAPAPPFAAGDPATAPSAVVDRVRRLNDRLRRERTAEAKAAAVRL